MVDSLVHQRSLTVGMTRHTHRYEMWAPLETVQSYANLVAFGERERNKLSLHDYDARDFAAEQRQAREPEVAEATRDISGTYGRAVIGEFSVRQPFTVG